MQQVLLIHCHPWPHKSRYNRSLLTAARQLKNVEVRDLYELYPNLHINETDEQDALTRADAVVFQFPIYWFSAPALLKEWQDAVLLNGFAYGDGGTALKGKKALFAVSTGGDEASYNMGARHGAPLDAFLLPFEMTVKFCGMEVEAPFITYNARHLDYDMVKERACAFARTLEGLASGVGADHGKP